VGVEFPHLERLSRAECRLLLPTASVGRLAVPTPNFPSLEPVSFALVGGEVVVAVRAGSAGDAMAAGTVVTFEADVLDRLRHGGWSVVVTGPVKELDEDLVASAVPFLRPWPLRPGDRLLRIEAEWITGQRVVAAAEPAIAEDRTAAEAADDGDPTVEAEAPALTRREITGDEALRLLERGGQPVGRLVITLGGEPVVFPLNYAVDGDAVVFRTQVGTKLTGITRSLATFEVDDIDGSGAGWSVAFEGVAQEVLDADPAALRSRLAAIDLETWPGGDRPHVVRITPYRVHGTAWTPAAVPAVSAAPPVPAS
jgi:nitroimidazol reductase NimA-like FMN-containing flavoprotein (pyridoxamine 5'-phosphate oxidase superfamily)